MPRLFSAILGRGRGPDFLQDEQGGSLVEYAIVIGLILTSVTSINAVSSKVSWAWSELNNNWTGPPPPPPAWNGSGPSPMFDVPSE